MNTQIRKDPMANFNLLSDDKKVLVNELAAHVFEKLGGNNIDTVTLLGFIDVLKPAMKIARNNSGVAEHQLVAFPKVLDEDASARVRKAIRQGDVISYFLKSKDVVLENLRVLKVTDKRVHVFVTENTSVVIGGKRRSAGDVEGMTFGTKYIDFKAIQVINDMDVYEYLSRKENAKKSSFPKFAKVAE